MRVRRGFTAIELATVIAAMVILAALTVPAVLPSLARARVDQAAGAIEQVARQARLLAMTRLAGDEHFGVVVVADSGESWVALTRGRSATRADIWLTATGEPVARIVFNPNVEPWVDGAALAGEVGWLYQFRSGHPVEQPSPTARAIAIGVPGSPVARELEVRSLDGRFRTGLAIYKVGLVARAEAKATGAP